MRDLDIRIGINGIRINNKPDIIDDINDILTEYNDVYTLTCTDKDTYKLFKDIRKQIKDYRSSIKSTIKSKVESFTEDITNDQKTLYDMFEELYNYTDNAIKQYEEENEIGAAKAKITRAKNAEIKQQEEESLTLTLRCPTAEAKARIASFATDLGAVIL